MTESTASEPSAPRSLRPTGITLLVVLATLYTLYFARAFLLPITFAILLDFLLSPVVGGLTKLRLPRVVAAAIVVLSLVGLVSYGTYRMAGPVQAWVASAPQAIATARRELAKLIRPFERVKKSAEQVERAAADVSTAPKPPVVVVQGPSIISRVFGSTQRFFAAVLEVVILLFFLLAAGDLFLKKLIKVLPNLTDKLKAVRIAREVQDSISTYLGAIAAINIVEGLVVAGALYLLGMPTPLLWGALVAALEFIPYLGAFTVTVVLAVAGLGAFESVGRALLIPGAFLVINTIQVNVVSPQLLGNRLALNPVAVFIGLAFWFWIWGVPGAFVGVPILAAFKICCDHIEALAPVGEFLGGKEEVALP